MNKILNGDCLEVLKTLPDNSIDSLVTDPPAGISFMGKAWDDDKGGRKQWIAWMTEVMTQCLRVMKPGAHGLVWAIPRTSHWTATALEDAGFEVRDVVTHIFGSGFPKSMNISIAIDKQLDAMSNRGKRFNAAGDGEKSNGGSNLRSDHPDYVAPLAVTSEAKQWQGWGTALKPASEHWILVRKPLIEKTVAKNVLEHGTGGINIDASRIEGVPRTPGYKNPGTEYQNCSEWNTRYSGVRREVDQTKGRFPANLVLSHNDDCAEACTSGCAVAELDKQSGVGKSTGDKKGGDSGGDSGGASRFFKVFKDNPKHAKETGCSLTNADNVGLNLRTIQGIEQTELTRSVLENVTLFIDSVNRCLSAKSAENHAINIETGSVLEVARMLSRTDLLLLPCQDFILDSRNSILIQNLVLIAGQTENIDTIQTINNLLKLSGCVLPVTEENIKQESQKNDNAHSRFLYCAKASKKDKNAGLEGMPDVECGIGDDRPSGQSMSRLDGRPPRKSKNTHPTVKSTNLMSYLIKLITPPNGIVLDPFMGSGSTGVAALREGFSFIGIEKDPDYTQIAEKRIFHRFPEFKKDTFTGT